MFLWAGRILCYVPLNIMHPTTIKGRKNMPKGKTIIACNHVSNWDLPLYYLNSVPKLKILAKKEIFKNKFFAWIMKDLGGIPIDRESNDINAIKTCMKVLKEDKKLFIFPEGTRLKNEEEILGEIKSGMAMIAIKTKTPIVPIWIERRPKLFRRSVYHIGEPFELSEFYGVKLDEDNLAKANLIVREKMLALREAALRKKKNKKKEK